MRKVVALLFVAALVACSNTTANNTQGAQWEFADPCMRDDLLQGGNGSLCKR